VDLDGFSGYKGGSMSGYAKRFGGIGRLYGAAGLERLRRAHVCVVGLGGVGSWAVEALARSGIGALTLVDLDDVCISNVNRQLHALDGEFGKPKVEVLNRRVKAIQPDCVVHSLHSFLLKSNVEEILKTGFDYVVDAIDSPSLKAVLIAHCRAKGLPVITVGAAGGRRDPTAIEVVDLASASHDRLFAQVRRLLRRRHEFPRGDRLFGVESVISREPVVYPAEGSAVCSEKPTSADLRLDCNSGYGTASFVTGVFAFVAVSRVVKAIVERGAEAASTKPAKSAKAATCRVARRGVSYE
jgi:tRNA A37 threonylcarbamoyladenosine dehydratase